MIEALEAAIAYELTDKAIPSISYVLFDANGVIARGDTTSPGMPGLPRDALLRIGSISKTFAAIAAMREVTAGRLDLDADVSHCLGPFDPSWQGERAAITLRSLLTHRSGLTREAGRGHYLADDNAPLAATVDSLRRSQLKVAPDGKTFRYSNAGFALAGACIEAASGERYADYVAEHIFRPLGMADTSMTIDGARRERLAPARMWNLDGDRPAPIFNLGSAPAGNVVATIDDLALYGRMLLGERLLPRQTLEALWRPAGGEATGYGMGFMIGEIDGLRTVGHGGVVYGYASQLTLVPEAQLGIAMVATLDATNDAVIRLCRYGLRLALAARTGVPKPQPPRRLPRTASATLDQLVGHYASTDGAATVELRERDGDLVLVDRMMPLRLRPLDDRRFTLDGRLHGEGSAHPAPLLERTGADRFSWGGHEWLRTEPWKTATVFTNHLGTYAPAFLPTRLISSGGRLVCVMEEFFPHFCEPLDNNHFLMRTGMYEDEILELGVSAANGRPAIRVGDMILERAP